MMKKKTSSKKQYRISIRERFSLKKIVLRFIALLPLLIGLAMLISVLLLRFTAFAADSSVMLSPAKSITPIVVSLVIFVAGYAVFLLFLFSEDIREALIKKPADNAQNEKQQKADVKKIR